MSKKILSNVIDRKHFSARLPFEHLAVIYLLMDRFNAAPWAYGIFISWAFLVLSAFIAKAYTQSTRALKDSCFEDSE